MADAPPRLGFVILSHAFPDQVLRLTETLNRLYGGPPIVCHHDFSQSALDQSRFADNVRFVQPSIRTGWGKWSVVAAFLAGLKLLYETENPDWFVLLSGADYPAMAAASVMADLDRADCDAFLDAHQIEPTPCAATLIGEFNPALVHLQSKESLGVKWRFYLARQVWVPIIRRKPRWRIGRYTVGLPWAARGFFTDDFPLFWGDHWFTASRRAAQVLLNPTQQHRALRRYLKRRSFPEECYYQTVLCNTPGLIIRRDNKRFTEWNGGGAHPMTLVEGQVPEIVASGAHFARKVSPDSPVLDRLDEAL